MLRSRTSPSHAQRTRPSAVLLVALSLLAATVTAACGGGGEDGGASTSPFASTSPVASTPRSAPPSASAPAKPDFTTPSASPSPTGVARVDVGGDLLVVRGREGDWAVWRVSPASGAEERLATLPFEPERAAASPDHRYVAYLKAWHPHPGWRRTLAIVDLDGGVVWPELRGTGLRRVNDLAWSSPSELVVSGPVPEGGTPPEDDRLFVYDVAGSAWRSFHDLRGTEPSVADGTGDVAFRRVTSLDDDALVPSVRDELVVWRAGAMSERPVTGETRRCDTPWSVCEEPVLSPDGRLVLVAETGSDVSVRWSLYRTRDGARLWRRAEVASFAGLGAWDRSGRRVAFWGAGPTQWPRTTVWVYDTRTGRFVKSLTRRDERVLEGWMTGLDWSRRGDLAASTSEGATRTVFVAPGGDPRAFVALCEGTVPVWLD